MKKYCSYCGDETWACGCGGHCFEKEEYEQWTKLFGKSKKNCRLCGEHPPLWNGIICEECKDEVVREQNWKGDKNGKI